jgi:hypothetical protein
MQYFGDCSPSPSSGKNLLLGSIDRVSPFLRNPASYILSCVGAGWTQLSRFLPEDGDRIQTLKRCVLNNEQDDR